MPKHKTADEVGPGGQRIIRVNSRLTSVPTFGNYTREQSLYIRILAYRLLFVDKMEQGVICRYLNVTLTQTRLWLKDIELMSSVFVKELVADMSSNPENYTREALVSRLASLGCQIGNVPLLPASLPPATAEQLETTAVALKPTGPSSGSNGERMLNAMSPDALATLMTSETPKAQQQLLAASAQQQLEDAALNKVPTTEVGNLILVYLQTALETMTIQAQFMRDEKWLRAQRAGELAQLHTAMSAHTLKIVEAMAVANTNPQMVDGNVTDDVPYDETPIGGLAGEPELDE